MKSQKSLSFLSTLPLLTILILAFLSLAKAQSCSDAFAELIKKRNISECKTLRTLDAEFGWNYHNGTNSTILEILFGAKLDASEGWIAWGVNPGRRAEMIGTKAIIGIKHQGTLIAKTYDVTKEIVSGCRLLPSDIHLQASNITMTSEDSIKPHFYTIYARLVLPSPDYNITRLNHVWQVGYAAIELQPLVHPRTLRNVDSTETIDLTSTGGHSTGQYRSYLRSVHGVLNIIGWGTLLPIGVIIARYFRVFPFQWKRIWFYLHFGCQLTGFLVGTAGFIIGLSLGHASRYYTFHTHRIFGIIIFTFSTVQMLAFRLKPQITDDYRKYWNMYHHFLGYGLLALIFINIFKGISILQGGVGWKWGFIGILGFLGAIALGLEIFTWIRFFMLKSKLNPADKDKGKGNSADTTNQAPSPQPK